MPRRALQEIIQNGRLAPGMAAVVRRDPDAVRGLHVFIYEHSSIQNWQAGKGLLALHFTYWNEVARWMAKWTALLQAKPFASCILVCVGSSSKLREFANLQDIEKHHKYLQMLFWPNNLDIMGAH